MGQHAASTLGRVPAPPEAPLEDRLLLPTGRSAYRMSEEPRHAAPRASWTGRRTALVLVGVPVVSAAATAAVHGDVAASISSILVNVGDLIR